MNREPIIDNMEWAIYETYCIIIKDYEIVPDCDCEVCQFIKSYRR